MKLTPCRLRFLATKVAPSTSLMSSLLSEWARRLHDISLDLVLDPVGVDRRRRARHAGRSVSAALSGPNRARPRASIACGPAGPRRASRARRPQRRLRGPCGRQPLLLPPGPELRSRPPEPESSPEEE